MGYGEITPRSFLGRVITLPLLVFGLLLIALPTFVLGREFSHVWDMMKVGQVRAKQCMTQRVLMWSYEEVFRRIGGIYLDTSRLSCSSQSARILDG